MARSIQDEQALVHLGKGAFARIKPIPVHQPWRGVAVVSHPYDAEQARWNEDNLPFLFGSEDGRTRSRR